MKTLISIVKHISKENNISEKEVRDIINSFVDITKQVVKNGESVRLRGFGSFSVKKRKPRRVYIPKEKVSKLVNLSPIPFFKPSKNFVSIVKGDIKSIEYIPEISSAIHFDNDVKIVESRPNPAQTKDLRINYYSEKIDYNNSYPIIYTPENQSLLKLPRIGRSDVRGYKEEDFINAIKSSELDISIADNLHITIPGSTKVYEPDIVLFDESLNLYMDVEIDEPYGSFLRIPTHTIEGNDNIRNVFFQESGWIVVRFSEKQVHEDVCNCIETLKEIISLIKESKSLKNYQKRLLEVRWDDRQSQIWEKELYREKYLGISSFPHQKRNVKIVNQGNDEEIDELIKRTPIYNENAFAKGDSNGQKSKKTFYIKDKSKDGNDSLESVKLSNLRFNENAHVYSTSEDLTGNNDRISVTSLIELFFPSFDEKAYIERKMKETGQSESDIRNELEEHSRKGTILHQNIENFLKGQKYDDDTKEFGLFLDFYEKEICRRNLIFDSAEYPIGLRNSNIAGTVDALFRKENGEYVMVDWKRSSHLIIDDEPKKYGYGRALSVISHLDNSSYYKYELQQSFYKYILEKEYGIKISSMILAVLHPKYDRYYTIRLSDYRRSEIIDMIEEYEKISK